MFECFPHCVCWCRLWVGQRRVYTPHSSSASRCKQRPSTHGQRQRVSTGGESVSACVTYKLKGTSFDGVLTAWKINTHTHTNGLIWTVTPSISPTHAVRQHNGPVCTHSNIQLTLGNGNKLWRRRSPLDLYPATTAHSIASPPVVTQFVSFFFFKVKTKHMMVQIYSWIWTAIGPVKFGYKSQKYKREKWKFYLSRMAQWVWTKIDKIEEKISAWHFLPW